jgi:Zn-dependent peptidase ImmA (M78 family)
MRTRIEALINPELLIWARESAGLSLEVASKKALISSERLSSWENGESRPTIPQLIKLGNVYKRPISVFYLSKPPKKFDALHDYRRIPGQPTPSLSPPLIYEIRKARERRQVALELYDLLGNSPPEIQLRLNLVDDPEKVSEKIRGLLKIGLSSQTRWSYLNEAYNEWRGALERVGILVFQSSEIKLKEMRGFSISQMPLPVIVTNNKDFNAPRIFSLIHEFAHILLRDEGICEFEETNLSSPIEQRVEVFCNHVAGAVLVPRESFLNENAVNSSQKLNSVDDSRITFLSKRYKVSKEVILRRLLHFGYISSDFYQDKKELYEEEAKKIAKEKALRRAKKDKGYPPYYIRVLSNNGKNLTNLILTSYYQDKITLSDVSDYLGIKLKHLPKIEMAMSRSFDYA